jgi:hypothetical protein
MYAELEPVEREVEPGERGEERLVNPVEDPTWPAAAAGARKSGRKGKER